MRRSTPIKKRGDKLLLDFDSRSRARRSWTDLSSQLNWDQVLTMFLKDTPKSKNSSTMSTIVKFSVYSWVLWIKDRSPNGGSQSKWNHRGPADKIQNVLAIFVITEKSQEAELNWIETIDLFLFTFYYVDRQEEETSQLIVKLFFQRNPRRTACILPT